MVDLSQIKEKVVKGGVKALKFVTLLSLPTSAKNPIHSCKSSI